MKKILFGLMLISSLSKAQAIFHIGAGTSTKAKCIVDGGFGYQYKSAMVEGSIMAPMLDNKSSHPAYFKANAGYELVYGSLSLTPLLGAAYRMQSTDKRSLNGFVASVGGRLKFRDVYVGMQAMDKTMFFSIGIGGVIGE